MKNKKINSEISDYCSLNKFEKAKEILKICIGDIDLTYKNGIYFVFAIKYNNVDMLNTLLTYYENTQLQDSPYTLKYWTAVNKLQIILQDAVDTFDISEEIQMVLDKYLPNEEASDQMLGEDENTMHILVENNFQNKAKALELTEDNLKKFETSNKIISNNGVSNEEVSHANPFSAQDPDLTGNINNLHHDNI